MSYRWKGKAYPNYESLPAEAKGLPTVEPAIAPEPEETREILTPTGPKTVKSKKAKAPVDQTETPETPAE